MSDPSIQTFCCHRPGKENPSISILTEFNSVEYNVVCLVSSVLGCLGAIYQMLPRRETQRSKRWFSLTSIRGRQLVVWLALADFLASFGVLMRSAVKLSDSMSEEDDRDETMVFCVILAAWIQYFYVVTWAWTLFYAIDTWLALKKRPGFPKLYHTVAWSAPAAITAVGLVILYAPDVDCHNYSANSPSVYLRLLPNVLLTYASILSVMIVCPLLYLSSARLVDNVVTSCLSQVTNTERTVIQSMKLRFGLINLSFYICWIPNLINGIVVWSSWTNLPRTFVLTLWYFMAVLNPLQALFNSIVYRRSNMRIIYPFPSQPIGEKTPLIQSK